MHIPTEITTFPEMVKAELEQQRARERIRDLQPIFVPHPVNEINHAIKTAKKAVKTARKKNRPSKKTKKGKKK